MGGDKVTMADKEERITIHKVLYPCKKCSINCNKNDWKDCDFYQNYISGMTRAEAVERIAKAICASNMAPDCLWECETCDRWKGSDKEAAEAALNALLEYTK